MKFGHYVAGAFIFNGVGSIGMKMLAQLNIQGITPVSLTVMEIVAAASAILLLLSGKWEFQKSSLIVGMTAGLCSSLGLSTSMIALSILPGYIVFPIISSGTILLVALVGRFAFREKVGPCGIAGIAVGVGAIILLTV